MAIYAVRIIGSNGSAARAWMGEVGFVSHGQGELGGDKGIVYVGGHPAAGEAGVPALFEDRELAVEVARACHWNSQHGDVVAARGWVRQQGRVVARAEGRIVSCQEG